MEDAPYSIGPSRTRCAGWFVRSGALTLSVVAAAFVFVATLSGPTPSIGVPEVHAQQSVRSDVSRVFQEQKSRVVTVTAQVGESARSGSMQPFRGGPQMPRVGQGSGFIVDAEGLVVTNHHVVASAEAIEVTLENGNTYDAELVGSDEKFDIALLSIDPEEELDAVEFGASGDVQVGQWVVAIGNPFGLNYSVTTGVVSAKGRTIGHSPYDNFIQTDASINPGNSGGPLFDLDGRVVAVNSAIIRNGQGIGFAVPADMVQQIIPQLRDKGYVERGYIGARLQPLTQNLAETYDLPEYHGVLVGSVQSGRPAASAGLERGDIVLQFDGERVRRVQDLMFAVAKRRPGTTVDVQVLRSGEKKFFRLELAARPDSSSPPSRSKSSSSSGEGSARLGIRAEALTDEAAARLGSDAETGVVVQDVQEGSPASRVLQTGDIIRTFGGETVGDREALGAAIDEYDPGAVVRILIERRGRQMFVAVRLR